MKTLHLSYKLGTPLHFLSFQELFPVVTKRNATVTKLCSREHIYNKTWITWWNFVGDVININCDLINFISKYCFLKKTWVAIFAGIIKIITRFIKNFFKDSRKGKGIRNYILKCNLYLYFLIQQSLLISGKKLLMSAEVTGVSRDSCIL